MTKNYIPDSTSSAWNILRCSSLEGFRKTLGYCDYTNRLFAIENIATAMLLLPPGVLNHRNQEDVDAVFKSLVRLGVIPKVTAAPQEELDAAMHAAMQPTEKCDLSATDVKWICLAENFKGVPKCST